MAEETKQHHLTVSELTADTRSLWDAYVRSASDGLPLHLAGWQDVMRNTYGYETRYLLAYADDRVAGVLPLFIVPSILTGRRAMTLPGGLCADSEPAARALINQGLALLERSHVSQLQLQDSRRRWDGNWQSNSQHVYWLMDMRLSEESLWKQLDGNIRRQVRKARKEGLETEIDRTGRLLDPFYDVFSRFTHRAGTPVFGRDFLANIIETFPGGFNIAIVWHENQPIAGYFQLEMGDTAYGMWGAALVEYRNLRAAYLAIWDIMSDAIDSGFTYLDMGRSPANTNASKFKGQWGGVSQPIYQQVINAKETGEAIDVTAKVQSDNRYQLFGQLWRKMPFPLTQFVGPKLRWHIPFA